ncbi:MAG: hypothetical protein HFACDABA_01747 [Anaerolineales bacterium]|nr:hypothetical protein [Anaerolineales bacterium]
MKPRPLLSWSLSLLIPLLAACGPRPSAPDPNAAIRQAVAATLAAIPSVTPHPTFTPRPSPTPFTLNGLFCEYNFCIGHPADLAFFDVSAQQNPAAPSSYSQGLLAAFNPNLFIQLIWQYAPGVSDPQFLMDLSLEPGADASAASFNLKLINNINVLLHPIQSTASPLLPHGLIAGWVCGDRAFAWKIYTPQPDTAEGLLQDALNRFRCE